MIAVHIVPSKIWGHSHRINFSAQALLPRGLCLLRRACSDLSRRSTRYPNNQIPTLRSCGSSILLLKRPFTLPCCWPTNSIHDQGVCATVLRLCRCFKYLHLLSQANVNGGLEPFLGYVQVYTILQPLSTAKRQNVVLLLICRFLSSLFSGGTGPRIITSGLKVFFSPAGKPKWNREALNKLLSKEKYTERVLLQKTVSTGATQIKKDSLMDRYLYTDSHETIISDAMFQAVQPKNSAVLKIQKIWLL